jgi:hypothetical protein
MVKQIQEQQQQEPIPAELITKFDNDEQLVRQFLDQGYTISDLQSSTVTHPTKYDPIVTLESGQVAGFWIDSPNEQKFVDNSRVYQNRTNKFFK